MTTINVAHSTVALQDLGFTEIEALVYTFLLQDEPSTAYRISHAIGKPTANTYKAVASLERRGAVQVDEGENRLVRAVPPDELLAVLERRERARRETARDALAALDRDVADDRVYALKQCDQVLERARAMLERARRIVLGDLFPGPLEELAADLAAAAARGVTVVVKSYRERSIARVRVVVDPDGEPALRGWPGQQLSLVADADEHLLAMLDGDLTQVHQAVWSRSTFLSCLHHNHVAMELVVTGGLKPADLAAGAALDASRELLGISVLASDAPGLRRLRQRFGAATSPAHVDTSDGHLDPDITSGAS